MILIVRMKVACLLRSIQKREGDRGAIETLRDTKSIKAKENSTLGVTESLIRTAAFNNPTCSL